MATLNKIELQRILQGNAYHVWDNLCEMYPRLVYFDCPKIIVNLRLTRTAGYNIQPDNVVHMAGKFMVRNHAEMLKVILPHELIHQADFNLNGIAEKKCGHGVKWAKMMVQYGLKADKYHSLEL